MCRALAVLRVVVLLNAVGLGWYRRDSLDHPWAAVAVLAAMAVWTAVAIWAYAAPQRRRAPLLVADLLVALAAIAASPYVKGDDLRATLPGFWVMGAVLAWAIHWRLAGRTGGGARGVGRRPRASGRRSTQTNYSNIFLLLLGGPIVGFLSRAAAGDGARPRPRRAGGRGGRRAGAAGPGRARRRAAGAGAGPAPRRRARRRGRRARPAGRGAGGGAAGAGADPGAVLGRRAGRPARPRRAGDRTAGAHHADGEGRGAGHARCRWTAPSPRSWWPLVRACLDNVSDHVGSDARAWVLLEDLGDRVAVSVRDDGPGHRRRPAGRGRRRGPARGRRVDPRPDRRARRHRHLDLRARAGHRVGVHDPEEGGR